MHPLAIVLELTRVAEPDDPHAFRFEPQGYTLRGPTGGLERFEIPWSADLLADLESLRRPGRDPAVVQRVGELLQRALRPIGWTALGEQIRGASEAGRPVLITLRSNAAELYALPWELSTVGASGQHLGELAGVLVRHEWPATASAAEQPAPRPEGGRVLFAWSAATGAIPAAEHQRAIAAAWSEGHMGFDPAADVLAHASPARLAEVLAAAEAAGRPFAVLHLLAHGGAVGSTFGLALDGDDEPASVVDAGRLRQLLAPHAGTLRLVVLAACDGANTGALGNHLGSVAQALHRAGIQSVVASRYPLSVAGSVVLAETLHRALLVDLHPLERAFTLTRTHLARRAEHLDWASLQLYARAADGDDTRPVVFCPYRGLLVFEARHRRFFFGRDAERRETLGDLQALIDADKPRFVVVVGASGTGKSSMVLSGVIPDVDRLKPRFKGPWDVQTMTPGAAPLATLHGLLSRRADTRPLLLIVDQFEELFTQTTAPGARAAFVRELWSLSGADSGLHVIVTLRVDFLGHCGDLIVDDTGFSLDRVAYDEAHRVFVARMARDQVRIAIEAPAACVGLTFAPGLLDRILADVGDEPGALPLLQYALGRLWANRRGRELVAEVYERLGGLVGALETDADALIRSLADDQKQHARRLLTQLVDTRDDETVDTRRRVALAQVVPQEAGRRAMFDAVLTRLVAARLVVRDERGGAPTLEVAHEALLRKWPTLRTWILEDRATLVELDRLGQWARDWLENGALLTGARLDRASEFVRSHRDDLDDPVRRLVEASEAERRRLAAAAEAQRRRRRNAVAAVISVLTIAVLGMTGISLYAFDQRAEAVRASLDASRAEDDATRARDDATAERDRARNATWMGYVRRFSETDPSRALLGLMNVNASATPEWLHDTLYVLEKPIRRVDLPGEHGIFSPDSKRVLTTSADGILRLWNADGSDSGAPLVLSGTARGAWPSFSPDGQRILATAWDDNNVRVWNADGSGEPILLHHELGVTDARFNPDGRHIHVNGDKSLRIMGGGRMSSGGDDNDLTWVWNIDGSGEPRLLEERLVDLSPDGQRMLTFSDETARVRNTDGSGEPRVLQSASRDAWSGTFSPDGRSLLVTYFDGTAHLWNADGSGKPQILHARKGEPPDPFGNGAMIESAAFSPDSQTILTASRDGRAEVRGPDRSISELLLGVEEADRFDEKPWIKSAKFSPDSRFIVAKHSDENVRVWSVYGRLIATVPSHNLGDDDGTSLSPDGRRVLVIDEDIAQVWNIDGSGEPDTLRCAERPIGHAEFSPDGARILTAGCVPGHVSIWNVASGEPMILGTTPRVEFDDTPEDTDSSTSISADGRTILTHYSGGTTRVWNADGSGEPVRLQQRHNRHVYSAKFRADGRILTVSAWGEVWLYNHDRSPSESILQRSDAMSALAEASFSPDGRRIVASTNNKLWVGNTDRPGDYSPLGAELPGVNSVSFSPDGQRILASSVYDEGAWVLNADGTGEALPLKDYKGRASPANFSPDGQRILAASADLTARIWNADGSGSTVALGGRAGPVRLAIFSPDGQRIATTHDDRTARVWNADGSGEAVVLRGLQDEDSTLWFSPDGQRILSPGREAVNVWSIDISSEPAVLRSDGESIESTAFTPDSRSVVVTSEVSVRVWNLDPAFIRERMAAATTLCIPPEERVKYIGELPDDACRAFTACEREHGRIGDCSLLESSPETVDIVSRIVAKLTTFDRPSSPSPSIRPRSVD